MENSFAVPQNVKIELSYDPAISLLGTDLREVKTYVYTKMSTQIYIEVLLILVIVIVDT